MGQQLTKCCDRKSCKILMIGSEKDIKYKILQRNFEDFIKVETGLQDYEETNVQVDQNIQITILDITPDRLESKYEKQIQSYHGIIYLTTPSYEEYDRLWIECLRENNIYLSKFILFFVDPDSDLDITDDAFPKQKVIVTKYDNDDQTEKGINWITQSIFKKKPYLPPTTAIQMS